MTESDSAPSPSPREFDDVRQMLEAAELTGVKFIEISARRLEETRTAPDEYGLQVMQNKGPDFFTLRFRLQVDAPDADYVVEVATVYKFGEAVDFSEPISREFIEKVAVMAAYPFLREALATSAARMELPVPILGLLRNGQFKLDPPTPSVPSDQHDPGAD